MKIVNIMQGTNLGGTEQASLRLMIELKRRGHICEVISLNPIGSLGPLLEEHAIPATGLPYLGRWGWRSFPLIRSVLRSIEADALIMTGHHLFAMLAFGNLCRGHRVLAIHHYHAGLKPSWQWRLIYFIACRRFQAITFPSDFLKKEAEMFCPAIKLLSHTVRNPITIPELPDTAKKNSARCKLGIPLNAQVVGNAGRLIPSKRFDVFLRTAQKLSQVVPSVLFVIAGDGEERGRLEALAHELGIAHQVRWLGWQESLSLFYKSMDVMLFNSDADAMGLAPMEAMSYGVPVVASVVAGGLKEVLDKDSYGFLLQTHDVETLSTNVAFLLQSPIAARRIALAGRDRVMKFSCTEQLVEKMITLMGVNNA